MKKASGLGLLCVILFTLPAISQNTPKIEICDMDNNTIAADGISIDAEGKCHLTLAAGEQIIPCDSVLEIVFSQSAPRKSAGWEFTLTNGDTVCGIIKEALKDGIKVESALLGDVNLGFGSLKALRNLSGSAQPATEKQAEDTIQFLSGDSDKGVVAEITKDSLKLNSSVYKKEKTYALDQIALVTISQLAPPPEEPKVILALISGIDNSRLTGQIKKLEGKTVSFSAPYKFNSAGNSNELVIALDKISRISFRNPNCVYLSDISPSSVKEYPTLYDPDHIIFPWNYQKDRNVMKTGPISVKGKKFYKGLGVHANCELTYKLDGKFRKFIATVGLDDTAEGKGTVQFVVYLDGKKAYESKVMKGDSAPETINLDTSGAKELKLVLNDGGDLHILDRAAWAGARLLK
ncbi:MAG: NPCBM/NEW2 domain-containing protein [Planctomycetes bacterium]|nr:NPCBM/NEW2 domain-containing protein [Planctomycetota bacterium]